jgi:outer membrane protein
MDPKINTGCFPRTGPGARFATALATALLLSACSAKPLLLQAPVVPLAPASFLKTLPEAPLTEPRPVSQLPQAGAPEYPETITLADAVDFALANNTKTRSTWLAARASAEEVQIHRAAFLPTVDVDGEFGHVNTAAVGGKFVVDESVYGLGATMEILLFDFGGRSARLQEAWAALHAADWSHNAEIQYVVLAVQTSFVNYLNAKAQLDAARVTVQEAETSRKAARRRQEVGVATVADLLQAQTALSQALLVEQTFAGRIQAVRGELATAMGMPADTPVEIGLLPEQVPVDEVTPLVAPLIEKALARRPDLVSARWTAEQNDFHLKSVKADGWPLFTGEATANQTYYLPDFFNKHDNNWSAALRMHFPLFTGFAHTHEVKKSEAEAESSRTQVTTVEQQVILEVWNSHAELTTAAQQVRTSRDLLASAEASERVALARYKQGAGSILDLLTAQTALGSARALEIQARSNWFLAVARLAYATGALTPDDDPAKIPEALR